MATRKKVRTLRSVARADRKRNPWNTQTEYFRHAVTVYVDTTERSSKEVLSTVQSALDEHTGTIQPDGVVEFADAQAIDCLRLGGTTGNYRG